MVHKHSHNLTFKIKSYQAISHVKMELISLMREPEIVLETSDMNCILTWLIAFTCCERFES
jgi:hypothetical protein